MIISKKARKKEELSKNLINKTVLVEVAQILHLLDLARRYK